MLIQLTKFGGILPIVLDPSFLPDGKSQAALNCRFDQGGLTPYLADASAATPGKSGTKLSIFRYYNLNDGNQYWFTWLTDVDAVTAPLPNDSYSRVFFTESGLFKVTDSTLFKAGGTAYPEQYRWPSPPVPAAAPTISGTPGGSDETLLESKAYVYTYVNIYGAEGPPSDPSNILEMYDGDTINITGMSVAPSDPLYAIVYKNIYRLNQTSAGTAQYQFVDQIAVATSTYTDTKYDAELAEVLPSLEWDGPPTGITGLIALPNGVLAGFVDNLLCLSVPFYPHAWPASWQQATDRPIVAIGAYGTTIVVATKGQPFLVVGSDPSNVVMEKMDVGFACLSKRGLVQAGEAVVYPSAEGLVVIGPTVRQVVTKNILTQDQWLNNYTPSSISAYYWQGKYVAFYTTGTKSAGFMYDLVTGDFIDIDFYATAGFYDKTVGTLFLQE
jgi:hypothetical protein